MAWTAPATFAVSEIVTAAKLNTHVRDNLDYLKGNAGAVTISDELQSVVAAGGTLTAQGTNNASFARYKMLAKDAGGAAIDWRFLANGNAAAEFSIIEGGSSERMRISAGGNLGIGYTAPQGRLHVGGPGGGVMFLSHNAVAGTIETLAVAGTVTLMAIMWGMIRNNGGSTLSFIGLVSANTFMLGTTLVVNCNTAADQVTITVTAGGAVTAQRTNGSNSHAVNLWVVYK